MNLIIMKIAQNEGFHSWISKKISGDPFGVHRTLWPHHRFTAGDGPDIGVWWCSACLPLLVYKHSTACVLVCQLPCYSGVLFLVLLVHFVFCFIAILLCSMHFWLTYFWSSCVGVILQFYTCCMRMRVIPRGHAWQLYIWKITLFLRLLSEAFE